MKYNLVLLLPIFLLLSACANPLNQATANRYLDQCFEAERTGRLDIAEQACYRALTNVDWGNLGEEQKSQNLYNLARIKARLGKLNESVDLHKQSIEIEKKLSPGMSEKIGRRYVELATVYLVKTKIASGEIKENGKEGENKLDDGVILLQELKPIAKSFSGQERISVTRIYKAYSEELEKQNKKDIAFQFSEFADKI